MSPDCTTPTEPPLSAYGQRMASRLRRGVPRRSPTEIAGDRAYERRRVRKTVPPERAWIDALKVERGCVDCGYNAHPAALEFDHLPGQDKAAAIASMHGRCPRAAIEAEIAKCAIVCANCHRVREAARDAQRREHVAAERNASWTRQRTYGPRPCTNCGVLTTQAARGRCHACYTYWRRTGSERSRERALAWQQRGQGADASTS